ncbi:Glycosyl transferase, group 1 [Streptococcus gordonii]|uniref:glycosyltransferase n=1 Tax=Streptococcus gordonii TaxID=1302 RepID=UPI0007798883|nr:glycosyltransferase [Streptococcus gordonii]VTT07775.1 Glycosyl transferase, group 1 [Streptococcus gordonii]
MNRDIIFVTHHLGGLGGVQRVVDQLAESFATDGNRVTVFGCGVQAGESYQKTSKNYEEVLLYSQDIFFQKPWIFFQEKFFNKKLEKSLIQVLDRAKDPIVILANPIVYLLMEKVIKSYSNKAIFIGQMHSSADFVFDSKGLYYVYPYIIKNKYPKLDKILFLSTAYSKQISEAYQIPIKKMGAIANPLPRYIKDSNSEINFDKSIISFVGRLDPVKQIDHIILAFSKIQQYFPNVTLEIYGEGIERQKLEALIKSLSLEEFVKLKGRTSKVLEVYQKSFFTLLTSKSEAFPMSIVESIVAGTPAITYNCSQGVEEIQSATSELLVNNSIEELADKMKFYLQNPHQLEELALKGREYIIDSYSEDIILNQWYQLFEELDKEK